MFRCELLTIHILDGDYWLDIASVDLFEYDVSGSLFAVRKIWDGKWEFDFLYFHLLKNIYTNWKEQ